MELKVLEYRDARARAPFKNSILSNTKLVGWIFTGKFPRTAHSCSKGVLQKRCHMGIQHLKALEFQKPGVAVFKLLFKLLLKSTQPCWSKTL